ncbi:MAG: site-2 protease family protein [Alphaproteobacteria bacterium]|nr:site-2 protease family protein [Alphaproteobacteria bacterium]
MTFIYSLTTWLIPLFLCVILHEIAHGYVAYKLGDKTAWLMGRLTLNPEKHIDIVGSIIVPCLLLLSGSHMLFGWAKPVPVDFSRLHNPKRDMGLVAVAGPLANVLLAIAFVLVGRVVIAVMPMQWSLTTWIVANLRNGISLSIILACFNLLPILPMDGGRILESLLPNKWAIQYHQTEKYGLFILFGVIFVLPVLGIDIINLFVGTLYPMFMRFISVFL